MKLALLPSFCLPTDAVPPVPAAVPVRVSARPSRPAVLITVFLLLAAGWSVYSRVTNYDFIMLDDPAYVYENQAVQYGLTFHGIHWAFTSLNQANWHPLTWLSLMADYQLYGLNAGGYHLTNLLLHETATVLLFLWLLLATRRLWPSAGVALLFCIHPAHVESVAWITERKDVLSSVFFFAALLSYTRYAQTKKAGYYVASILALILGLMAKPMLVTVPPLLLLLDAWPLGRVRRARDLVFLGIEKLPFALVAAASCAITYVAQHRGGATISLEHLPISGRVATMVTAYVAYLGELFWPHDLGIFYPYWLPKPMWQTAGITLGLGLATLGAAWLYRSRPYVLIGWLWFLGTLVPVIGLVQVGGQSMADRYTYLPFVGPFIALCWAAADLWRSLPRLRPALAVTAAGALTACLTLCWRQVGYWQDSVTLMEHTLAVTRPIPNMYILLGDSYSRLHRYSQAETTYRVAFQKEPDNVELVTKLGYLQLNQGHWELARRWLQQVAARSTCKDATVYNNYGFVLNRLGREDEARAAFRRCLELNPGYAYAHSNLADLLLADGHDAAAVAEYETALSLKPDIADALTSLAWLYSIGDSQRNPSRATRALTLARRAVDLTGGHSVESLDALAAAQAAVHDWSHAAVAARAALHLAANQPNVASDVVALHKERLALYLACRQPER